MIRTKLRCDWLPAGATEHVIGPELSVTFALRPFILLLMFTVEFNLGLFYYYFRPELS